MTKIIEIDANTIKNTIKTLCFLSSYKLDKNTYLKIENAFKKEQNQKSKDILQNILQNAHISNQNKRPLCQDTGQVIVFAEIGQDVHIKGDFNQAINDGVAECYIEKHLRKSINTALLRENTTNNTPAIIHTNIISGNHIKLSICLKGGGSENMSQSKMLYPALGKQGIIDFVIDAIKKAGLKACPPYSIGVGIGGNLETSGILSKKALIQTTPMDELEKEFLDAINKTNIGASGEGGTTTALSVKILEAPCHIASLPVSIAINCHSSRHSSAIIKEDVVFDFEEYNTSKMPQTNQTKEVFTDDINAIKNLKTGENILLSGTIYTARDEAHKKLLQETTPPFEIKNSIIFYAGPCPATPDEIIGPIGPTTSTRMDSFTPKLLEIGLIATIGKGERKKEVLDAHKKHNAVYFTAIGGIASLLQECIKDCELVAYKELGPEAIYKLKIEKLPLKVACGKIEE